MDDAAPAWQLHRADDVAGPGPAGRPRVGPHGAVQCVHERHLRQCDHLHGTLARRRQHRGSAGPQQTPRTSLTLGTPRHGHSKGRNLNVPFNIGAHVRHRRCLAPQNALTLHDTPYGSVGVEGPRLNPCLQRPHAAGELNWSRGLTVAFCEYSGIQGRNSRSSPTPRRQQQPHQPPRRRQQPRKLFLRATPARF